MYKKLFKRVTDFCVIFIALGVLFAPLLIITLWLYFANKGAGVFFMQERPGKINVLKGDMALIGPRPLLPQYLPLYSKEQARRHEVRPGITGWAQVNGRNAISWTRKFELDVWYVDHCSFLLDLKIIFITIKKVFVREGISSETSVTMEAFTGNN